MIEKKAIIFNDQRIISTRLNNVAFLQWCDGETIVIPNEQQINQIIDYFGYHDVVSFFVPNYVLSVELTDEDKIIWYVHDNEEKEKLYDFIKDKIKILPEGMKVEIKTKKEEEAKMVTVKKIVSKKEKCFNLLKSGKKVKLTTIASKLYGDSSLDSLKKARRIISFLRTENGCSIICDNGMYLMR